MVWVVVPVLVCTLGLGFVAVRARRDQHLVREMAALATDGRHQQVLDHALPRRAHQDSARSLQATSAVLTGRYRLAMDLLAASSDDGTYPSSTGPATTASRLRAVSLVGLGRYGEVARLIGDQPPPGPLRNLRAQAAIEVGDDDLATRLLAVPSADPLEDAGRMRLLGDLHLRRGRLDEGERLVRTARASFAGSGTAGAQVDVAVCSLLLAQARLAAGRAAEAVPLVRAGLEGLAIRPDHAPGFAEAHAVAARVEAALGHGAQAGRHLADAQGQASRCQSPPLDADLTRAAALVALDLGDDENARLLLREAIAAHEVLGAEPVVADLRTRLTAVDR